jgi:predicted Zn-dependent peptidase
MSSRIFGKARKRGLVYGMGSDINTTDHMTSWDFDGEVNLETADELFKLIQVEMMRVLNGEIEDSEIEAAKSYAEGRYQMGAQTVGQIADHYTETYFMTDEIEDYEQTPNIIKSITKANIVELARELVASNINSMVAVGSVEKAVINDLASHLKF